VRSEVKEEEARGLRGTRTEYNIPPLPPEAAPPERHQEEELQGMTEKEKEKTRDWKY
jgi:hypothetical protein